MSSRVSVWALLIFIVVAQAMFWSEGPELIVFLSALEMALAYTLGRLSVKEGTDGPTR